MKIDQTEKLFDQYYFPLIDCLPRSTCNSNNQYESPTFETLTKIDKWQIMNSFYFREEFIEKNEKKNEISSKCFEVDWRFRNLQKRIPEKQGRDNLKQLLKTVYANFLNTYKNLASNFTYNEKFYISKSTLEDFCNKSQLLTKFFNLDDFNNTYNLIKSYELNIDKNRFQIPENCLTRPEFLEFLIYLCQISFTKRLKNYDFSAAFKYSLENGLYVFFNNYSPEVWRNDRLWTEGVEKVIQFYYPFLNVLFKKYAVSKFIKNQSFLTLHEAYELVKENVIEGKEKNYTLKISDLNLFFFLSIPHQIDEIYSERWVTMNFLEFIEFFARIAEKLCLPCIDEKVDGDYPSILINLDLHIKLEALIYYAYNNCKDNDITASINLSHKSIFSKIFNSPYIRSPKARRMGIISQNDNNLNFLKNILIPHQKTSELLPNIAQSKILQNINTAPNIKEIEKKLKKLI